MMNDECGMMNEERAMSDLERTPEDLKVRTKRYALRVIRLFQSLSASGAAGVIGRQLLHSATSVGAQYREACRARSTAEFVSKIESALQELSESEYWIELLIEGDLVKPELLADLLKESRELIAIFTASATTAKRNRDQP